MRLNDVYLSLLHMYGSFTEASQEWLFSLLCGVAFCIWACQSQLKALLRTPLIYSLAK